MPPDLAEQHDAASVLGVLSSRNVKHPQFSQELSSDY